MKWQNSGNANYKAQNNGWSHMKETTTYRHLLPLWLMFNMAMGYLVLERSPKSTNKMLKATKHGVTTKLIGVRITKCWKVRCKCLARMQFWRKISSKSNMALNFNILAMRTIHAKKHYYDEMPSGYIVQHHSSLEITKSHKRNNYRHLLRLLRRFNIGLGYLVLER